MLTAARDKVTLAYDAIIAADPPNLKTYSDKSAEEEVRARKVLQEARGAVLDLAQGANNQRGGFRCMRCGSTNSQHNCTAIGATCKKCGKKGHYKGVCLTPVRDGQTGKGNSKAKVATTSQATTTAKANVASSSS